MKKVAVIGLGGYGWNFLYNSKGALDLLPLCIDSLSDEGRERRERLPDIAFDTTFSESSKKQIAEFVKDLEYVFVVAGLSGSNGGVISTLLEILKECKVLPICMLVSPFAGEGESKCKLAQQRLSEIEKTRGVHIVFSNELLLKNAKSSMGMRELYGMQDQVVIAMMQEFSAFDLPLALKDLFSFYDRHLSQHSYLVEKIGLSL